MERIGFFFALNDSQSFRNEVYQIQLCSKLLTPIQNGAYQFLQMTHNHSETDRISFFLLQMTNNYSKTDRMSFFFFAPNDS